jgi:hypothetical protein
MTREQKCLATKTQKDTKEAKNGVILVRDLGALVVILLSRCCKVALEGGLVGKEFGPEAGAAGGLDILHPIIDEEGVPGIDGGARGDDGKQPPPMAWPGRSHG